MGAREEVAEIDKFAVILILDIDHAPSVLATTDLFTVDDDVLFASNDGERDNILDIS